MAKMKSLLTTLLLFADVVGITSSGRAELVHRWSFNDGTANDSVGVTHGTLYGTATVTNGHLRLSGSSGVNRMETAAFGHVLTNKTLVVWCALDDSSVQYKGSVLSVKDSANKFDGIVYAERTARQWMNGSEGWRRTPVANNGGALEHSEDPDEIMMAITYDKGTSSNPIKIYRNGVLYVQVMPVNVAATNFPTTSSAVIGPRGSTSEGYFNGTVNEARIYDTPLSEDEIAVLYAEGPNPVADLSNVQLVHRWTFDGTADDSVGMANGTLYGYASITNGRLFLTGSHGTNRMETSAFDHVLTNKTLVSWCTLDDPRVRYMGSVLTVMSSDSSVFDGIVYAENATNQWRNGSDAGRRTGGSGSGESADSTNEIMMVIAYDGTAANKIKIYRNGVPYLLNNPSALTNFDTTAKTVIGPRHHTDAGYINGSVGEARIYGTALSPLQVAEIYAQGPDMGSVWVSTVSGDWNRGSNWTNLLAAGGSGNTADFSALNLATDTTVALNGSRMIGKLAFGDLSGSHDWALVAGSGGTLTLAAAGSRPEISVGNRTATVAVPLAGMDGFVKTGAGTLKLASINTYQGPTVVAEGTLSVQPVPYGTVAAYGFDAAANLGLDSSSQNNTLATSEGAPECSTDGKFGGSLYLNGSTTLRTASGMFPSGVPTGAAPYTVSAFIKASPLCSDHGGWIGYGSNANNRCNCYRLIGSYTNIWNYWYYNDMGATISSGSFTDGWHSVVGTWNGKEEALFIDGVKRASRTPDTKIDAGTNDFVIGRTTADVRFNGWIDDVLIANRALSQEEIAALDAIGFQAVTRLPTATDVQIAAGAKLDLNGTDQTVAGLSGAGLVTNGAALTVTRTLAPGDDDAVPATLSVRSGLILSGGAVLTYNYGSDAADSVAVSGTLTLAGTNTVWLSAVNGAAPPERITLFSFENLNGSWNLTNWTVQGEGLAGKQLRVRSDNSKVYVTISPLGMLIRVF